MIEDWCRECVLCEFKRICFWDSIFVYLIKPNYLSCEGLYWRFYRGDVVNIGLIL